MKIISQSKRPKSDTDDRISRKGHLNNYCKYIKCIQEARRKIEHVSRFIEDVPKPPIKHQEVGKKKR